MKLHILIISVILSAISTIYAKQSLEYFAFDTLKAQNLWVSWSNKSYDRSRATFLNGPHHYRPTGSVYLDGDRLITPSLVNRAPQLLEWVEVYGQTTQNVSMQVNRQTSVGGPTDQMPTSLLYLRQSQSIIGSFTSSNKIISVNYTDSLFEVAGVWFDSNYDEQFENPGTLLFDPSDQTIIVCMPYINSIWKFFPDGTLSRKWWLDIYAPILAQIVTIIPTISDSSSYSYELWIYSPSVYQSKTTTNNQGNITGFIYRFSLPDGTMIASFETPKLPELPMSMFVDSKDQSITFIYSSYPPTYVNNLGQVLKLSPSSDLDYWMWQESQFSIVLYTGNEESNIGTLGTYQWSKILKNSGSSFIESSQNILFEPCAAGATGDTSSSLSSLHSCDPASQKKFIATDNQSIYLLEFPSNSYDKLCFDNYIYRVINGSVKHGVYDSFTQRHYFIANNSDIAYIYEPCSLSNLATQSPRLNLLSKLTKNSQPTAMFLVQNSNYICHITRGAMDISCYPSNAQVLGTKFTKPLTPTVPIFDANWDNHRQRLWVVSNNPILRVFWFTFNSSAVGFSLDQELLLAPPNAATLLSFSLLPLTGQTLWRFSGTVKSTTIYELDLTTKIFKAIENSFIPASFNQDTTWVQAVFSPPYYDPSSSNSDVITTAGSTIEIIPPLTTTPTTNSTDSLMPTNTTATNGTEEFRCTRTFNCYPWSIIISMCILFGIPLILLGVVILLAIRKRWLKSKKAPLILYSENGDDYDDQNVRKRLEAKRYSGGLPFPRIRKLIRKLFCFCNCCYDKKLGTLICCFKVLGGYKDNGNGKYHAMEELPDNSNSIPMNDDNNHETTEYGTAKSSEVNPIPDGDPTLGLGTPPFTQVNLNDSEAPVLKNKSHIDTENITNNQN